MAEELNRLKRIKSLLQDTKLIDSHTISAVVAECDAVIFAQRSAVQQDMAVHVCQIKDAVCGDRSDLWCDKCPKTIAALQSALALRPAAQEVDDGDITGQVGPLPETGWDEVPEGAFPKPSPTAGMNLGERIKHVGGRENAAGYIEFGSVAAVRALVRQYLRDLPAPQQATPATPEDMKVYDGIAAGYFADTQQATPEPVGWTDADADAARLAMELECLLLGTKDTAAVSRWWKSANEALDLHRARLAAAQAKGDQP